MYGARLSWTETMELLNELIDLGFVYKKENRHKTSLQTSNRHALSDNPKTVTRIEYFLTEKGKVALQELTHCMNLFKQKEKKLQ